MAKILLYLTLIQLPILTFSQSNNQILIGGSFLGIDSPNNHGYRFILGYAKTLTNNRIKHNATISGFSWKVNNWEEISGIKLIDERNRIFIDFNSSFAPIKFKNNYLRFGIGPTIMYLNDTKVNNIKTTLEYDTKTKLNYFKYISHETTKNTKLSAGINLMVGIEISLSSKFFITSDLSLLLIDRGTIPIINTCIGYKF